jgi:hypothetical protein
MEVRRSISRKLLIVLLCLGMIVILANCGGSGDSKKSGDPTSPGAESDLDPNLVIDDPLTNGQTVGDGAYGGIFRADGFEVTTNYHGYLAYSTDIIKNIRIEFDARGYVPWEDDEGDGKMVIVEIFDSPHSLIWNGPAYDSQYCLFHFRKRGLYEGQYHYKVDGVEIKFGGKGNTDEVATWNGSPAGHPLEWDEDETYHWVIIIQNGTMEITRNEQVIFAEDCSEFDPDYPLNVRIGGVPYPGRSGSQGVIYSNVKISRL